MQKLLFLMLFLCISGMLAAQNVGIGTSTPANKLSVVGKVNITDSLGVGITSPKAKLDVLGNTLLRGINTNTFNTPSLAAVEFFTGRNSIDQVDPNQASADVAFNWGGAGGGYRHFIETRHDVVPGNGNELGFYINNSGTAAGSSTPGTGNTLQMAITGSGIGVGTNSPHASAQIEISSTNKGLLLPRVNDTTLVSAPAEGLMVYNKNLKMPSFFNGSGWQSMQNTAATLVEPDSITYTVSANANTFVAGTYRLSSETQNVITNITFSSGGGTASAPNFSAITFVKTRDVNSTAFIRTLTLGVSTSTFIEIKYYKAGINTPYYSVKATNFFVSGFNINTASGSLVETITIEPIIYGYKDWINNTSYAYNQTLNTSVAY